MPRNQRFDNNIAMSDDIKSISKKAIYTAAIGAAGAYLLFDEKGSSTFVNLQMPTALAAGLGAGIGSAVSDYGSDWVMSKLDQSNEIKTVESTAIKLAVAGVGTGVALKYASNIPLSVESVALGSISKFGGDAVYNQVDPLAMLF